MSKITLIIFSSLITSVCYAQVADDFSDGDFTMSPAWSGSNAQFIVNASKQLQLNSPTAGTSYLSTAFSTTSLDNYEWQGYVKQTFSSSGSNYGRVYLVSDQADLTQPLNGYYLQFGEALSNDAVELFRQSGTISTSVCRGPSATIATSFALRFKVTRDPSGLWTLSVDHTGGNNFVQEKTGIDSTYTSSNYFGVRCTYTLSNASKFYFDDFITAPISPPDLSPPTVSDLTVLSSNSIAILYSEVVDTASAQETSNYSVSNNIGIPASALLQSDNKTVVLTFASPFINGAYNQISISSVQDHSGNTILPVTLTFRFYEPDKTPPVVSGISVDSDNSLSILFSELLDTGSAQNTTNYSANNNLGNPASSVLQPDGKTVSISFSDTFINGQENLLTITSVNDTARNVMADTVFSFLFFKPSAVSKKDIIFSEIFPDPSPQVGLPNAEYVEIYNRSSNPINLKDWVLSDGLSNAFFPLQIILPDQYWIITSSSNVALFSGKVMGVPNFPTLNNSGDNLTLKFNGQSIDSITYTLDWYHDSDKQEGGWSLEIIDPNNTCGEIENWTSSEDDSGGTPGKQNSVFANKPDLTGPMLQSVVATSDSILILTFDEKLEEDISLSSFEIDPTIPIAHKSFTDRSLQQIRLVLQQKLSPRTLYQLSVANLTDCAGNPVQTDFSKLPFVLPEAADSMDIIINEILFNPRSGGVDFVEVYNNSPKYINLRDWALSHFENGSAKSLQTITENDLVITPSAYVAFTPDPIILASQYPQAVQKNLFTAMPPSLPDDEGTIAIVSDSQKVIDQFSYSDKMHSPFLKDVEGVSLERISFSEPTNESANWKSANASAGFATPGYLNSNARAEATLTQNAVSVEPEIFSPTTPGMDFAKINFRFDQSGMVATIKVLDPQGRLVKTVASNETVADAGSYRWDGDRDDGAPARLGYYIVWFEVFDRSGFTQVFRKRAVIAK